MGKTTENLIMLLKTQHEQIKKLVFCNNCKSSGHCYIENVFKLVRLQNGYCGAGVARTELEVDVDFQNLISNMENLDNLSNAHEILQQANHELRQQNRILRHLTQCKNCTNHRNCDAEDELIRKQAPAMFCCVGGSIKKEEEK